MHLTARNLYRGSKVKGQPAKTDLLKLVQFFSWNYTDEDVNLDSVAPHSSKFLEPIF